MKKGSIDFERTLFTLPYGHTMEMALLYPPHINGNDKEVEAILFIVHVAESLDSCMDTSRYTYTLLSYEDGAELASGYSDSVEELAKEIDIRLYDATWKAITMRCGQITLPTMIVYGKE